MYYLVLDPSSLIPDDGKSEEDKEAIINLGIALPNVNCFTLCLSSYLVKLYKTSTVPHLKRNRPLPAFQARLVNQINMLRKLSKAHKQICKPITSKAGLVFHILETSKVEFYNVDNLNLEQPDDRNVLKVALAAAYRKTFLVTTDRHFLEDLNKRELERRYPSENHNLNIIKPNDDELVSILIASSI